VQQTIRRAEGFDHSVLLHLIDEAIAHHWNQTVRTKAEVVRALLPKEVQPAPPKGLPTDAWNRLMEVAQHRYPGDTFQGPAKVRRKPRGNK
jgi:hypothetical protein